MLAQWLSRFLVGFLDQRQRADLRRRSRSTGASSPSRRCWRSATCLVFGLMPAIRATGTSPGRGDESRQPRLDRHARAVRSAARARRRAGGAVARAGRRRAALRPQPAQPDDDRRRLPAGRSAGGEPRSAESRRPGGAADRAVRRHHRTPRRAAGRDVSGAGVHRAGQRQRLEQQHRRRRRAAAGQRQLQQRQRRLLQDDGHADAGRARPSTRRTLSASEKVAIVTEVFARKYFPNQNPIGEVFQIEEGARAAAAVLAHRRRRERHEVHRPARGVHAARVLLGIAGG